MMRRHVGGLPVVCLMLVLGLAGCATSSGVDRTQAAQANANLGAEYLRRNQNDRAAQAFERALDHDASNFTANWGMAVVNDRLNVPDQARHYFEKTLSVRQSSLVYNSYAAFLCKRGQTEAGVRRFDQALSAPGPVDRADTLANAGLCLSRGGRPDAAENYFQRALEADPRQATALTQLAEIAYHAQDYMRARAFIERADAATTLDAEQLRLAARVESALNDQSAAASYMKRYNANRPGATTPGQLEPSRQ